MILGNMTILQSIPIKRWEGNNWSSSWLCTCFNYAMPMFSISSINSIQLAIVLISKSGQYKRCFDLESKHLQTNNVTFYARWIPNCVSLMNQIVISRDLIHGASLNLSLDSLQNMDNHVLYDMKYLWLKNTFHNVGFELSLSSFFTSSFTIRSRKTLGGKLSTLAPRYSNRHSGHCK